jgi:hypothetical protein
VKLRFGDSGSTIFPLLQLDWQLQIDQSCLEERQREHVARMHMERVIERIAAALPELEMRAIAAPTISGGEVTHFLECL